MVLFFGHRDFTGAIFISPPPHFAACVLQVGISVAIILRVVFFSDKRLRILKKGRAFCLEIGRTFRLIRKEKGRAFSLTL